MFKPEDIAIANRTARANGAVGSRALVPRFVLNTANERKLERTLDYGAGPTAPHTAMLRENGVECWAWDFGSNFNPEVHIKDARKFKYDTVMMSNVLNVQASREAFDTTLNEAAGLINKNGRLVANYPKQPRKSDLAYSDVVEALKQKFSYVVEVEPLVFECYNVSTPMREIRRSESRIHKPTVIRT